MSIVGNILPIIISNTIYHGGYTLDLWYVHTPTGNFSKLEKSLENCKTNYRVFAPPSHTAAVGPKQLACWRMPLLADAIYMENPYDSKDLTALATPNRRNL